MGVFIDMAAFDTIAKNIGTATEKAARRGLLSAAHRVVGHIQTTLIPQADPQPVDRGIYKAAWGSPESISATERGVTILNTAPHALFIERGVRAEKVKPGRKMIDALTEWVRRKGIGGTVTNTKAGRKLLSKATETEARGIAFAIANSMRKRGIFAKGRGLRIAEKAAAWAPDVIQQEVRRELARALGGK